MSKSDFRYQREQIFVDTQSVDQNFESDTFDDSFWMVMSFWNAKKTLNLFDLFFKCIKSRIVMMLQILDLIFYFFFFLFLQYRALYNF